MDPETNILDGKAIFIAVLVFALFFVGFELSRWVQDRLAIIVLSAGAAYIAVFYYIKISKVIND